MTNSILINLIFSFSFFISTFFHKTKKVLPLCLGFVFISYFLVLLAEMSKKVSFLKYFSVFTLADIRGIIVNESMKIHYILVSILLTIVLLVLSAIRYNKKELI